MPWQAKCYECEQEAGINRPTFATLSSFLAGDLQDATAFYETHPRSPTDTRPCSGAGKGIPKYQMRAAYSTTPDEDPANLDPRGIRRCIDLVDDRRHCGGARAAGALEELAVERIRGEISVGHDHTPSVGARSLMAG